MMAAETRISVMGCDIHTRAERKVDGKWEAVGFSPFRQQNYGVFGFLADVRNYSAVPPLAPRRGLPEDLAQEPDLGEMYRGFSSSVDSNWDLGDHSYSWLSMEELLSFDYDALMEDRRVTVQTGPNSWNGGATADPGGGRKMTYREFLGKAFFEDLEKLKELKADRVVFGFDS